MLVTRKTGAIATNPISICNSMSKMLLHEPFQSTIKGDAVDLRKAAVEIRMADRTASLEQCHQRDHARTGNPTTGSTDEASRHSLAAFLGHKR